MKKTKQLLLSSIFSNNYSKSFGGTLLNGKRKSARPISTKKFMHIVFKSKRARGHLSFLNHRGALDKELQRLSKKWHVKIFNRVWVANHIHMILKATSRDGFKNFLRELGAAIVRTLEKKIKLRLQNFFEFRPFSRILEYGRDFKFCVEYLIQNELENFGMRMDRKCKRSKLQNAPAASVASLSQNSVLH